jgi:hypothetical protein
MGAVYIRGVDEPLPEDEKLLWEGGPDTAMLARHAFKTRWIAAYFVVLAGLATVLNGLGGGVARGLWLLLLGAVAVGLVTGWAWLVARSTTYALTDRRIVMRLGVAFPSVFNLPLEMVGDAWIRTYPDRSGDVAFQVQGSDRIGYAFLWPHVRPWRVRDPQPMFRGLVEVSAVGEQIRTAVKTAHETAEPITERKEVVYSLMDDDGIEILSNRRPKREPQKA